LSKNCKGCGIELQSIDKEKQGYVPEDVLLESTDILCQRCFKISNYGSYLPHEMSREDYRKEVKRATSNADVVLAVFDIIDFEGSFDDEILDILREKDSIIAINKIDLIPDRKHPSEVSNWVKERLADEGIAPLDLAIISAKNKYGVNGIIRKINHFYPKGANVAVLGTTNVGKSSLINGLLKVNKVTTSKYPGTTLKSVKNKIEGSKINIIDTPGLLPEGRVSDLVCESCNLKIVPANEISRKTFKPKKDRIILLGGMVKIKNITEGETKPIFSIYASKNVNFHETNEERVEELIRDHLTTLLSPPCEKCVDSFMGNEFGVVEVEANEGEEIVIKGLGWISVKRGPLKLELTLPSSCDVLVRDAFIQPKRG